MIYSVSLPILFHFSMRSPSAFAARHAEGFYASSFYVEIFSLQAPGGDKKTLFCSFNPPPGACLLLISRDIFILDFVHTAKDVIVINTIYEELIEGIPESITADFVAVGPHITIVEADGFTGVAETEIDENRPRIEKSPYSGKSLHSLAKLVYSWNFTEASIGLAAICAFYNRANDGTAASFRYL